MADVFPGKLREYKIIKHLDSGEMESGVWAANCKDALEQWADKWNVLLAERVRYYACSVRRMNEETEETLRDAPGTVKATEPNDTPLKNYTGMRAMLRMYVTDPGTLRDVLTVLAAHTYDVYGRLEGGVPTDAAHDIASGLNAVSSLTEWIEPHGLTGTRTDR